MGSDTYIDNLLTWITFSMYFKFHHIKFDTVWVNKSLELNIYTKINSFYERMHVSQTVQRLDGEGVCIQVDL